MVFGFFRRRKKEEKSAELSVKELNKLLKEGKYGEIIKLLKDRYRENNQFLEIYFTALVEDGKVEEAKKILAEVGRENLSPKAVAKLLEEKPKRESLFEKFKRGLRKTRKVLGLENFFKRERLGEDF